MIARARTLAGLLAAILLAGAAVAAETGAAELDSARADLSAAKFDKALATLDALLARSDLAPETVAAALSLRAQARVATGDLPRAEQDWKRLLLLRPDYEPDATTTGRKARERFDRVAATVVGSLKFEIDPPEARITVDGRTVVPAADGTLRLPAGERRIGIEHPGFDPAELGATVLAGDLVPVRVRLVPNARTVLLRTEPDGVEVRLDGTLLGTTKRSEGAGSTTGSSRAARLEIAELPLGEHVFELTKPCFRTTRVRVQVQVDVADRGSILLDPVALDPARAVVDVVGRPEGAEVRADGVPLGRVPVRGVTLCAGPLEVEVHAGGRVVWSSAVDLPEQGTATIEVAPRPQALLLGSETWPAPLQEVERRWGTRAKAALPKGADLKNAAGWSGVELPADVDLAAAVLPAEGGQAVGRVVVYSPILRTVEIVDAAPRSADAPARTRASLGIRFADLPKGGAVVAEVAPGSPAASAGIVAGSRVVRIGSRDVATTREANAIVASLAVADEVALELEVPGEAQPRRVPLRPMSIPEIDPAATGPAGRAIAAAWAAVDAAGSPDRGLALLQLGSLLLAAGRPDAAADAFTQASSAPGRIPGIADYLRGRALAAAGREDDARAAFAAAKEARGRARGGDGVELAPAASDHLADLGVAPR